LGPLRNSPPPPPSIIMILQFVSFLSHLSWCVAPWDSATREPAAVFQVDINPQFRNRRIRRQLYLADHSLGSRPNGWCTGTAMLD